MVNNFEFAERLKNVMEYYNLTATALADSIAIQRSSISHLLSGRNKPSLDFVMKVLEKYPDVTEIELWDDRELHIPIFEEFGAKLVKDKVITSFIVNLVPANRH